jgi:hypothetical protein
MQIFIATAFHFPNSTSLVSFIDFIKFFMQILEMTTKVFSFQILAPYLLFTDGRGLVLSFAS